MHISQLRLQPMAFPMVKVKLTAGLVLLNLLDEMEELGHYRGNWKVVSWRRRHIGHSAARDPLALRRRWLLDSESVGYMMVH